jgi:hypothetical protein
MRGDKRLLKPALPAFVSPGQAQVAAVLNHSRALPQGDRRASPLSGLQTKRAFSIAIIPLAYTSRPVLPSVGDTNLRMGWPAWCHPEMVSKMIFMEAEAI